MNVLTALKRKPRFELVVALLIAAFILEAYFNGGGLPSLVGTVVLAFLIHLEIHGGFQWVKAKLN